MRPKPKMPAKRTKSLPMRFQFSDYLIDTQRNGTLPKIQKEQKRTRGVAGVFHPQVGFLLLIKFGDN